jgi:cysteine synthase A
MLTRALLLRPTAAAAAATRAFHASAPAQRIYEGGILDTVGDTPVVKINKLGPDNVNIYVKCEFFNPLSSVKDRLALGVIEAAERSGALQPGQTVIEATSGNTGIALAMVCAQKGYPCIITMAEPFSVERRKIMRQLGASVIVTPAANKGTGMVKKAKELAKELGAFQPSQFENEDNPNYHAKTTGPEIISDFANKGLDYWVTGYGTGGTLAGAGRMLKAAMPSLKIVISEPVDAPLLGSGKPQKREADGSSAETHPAFNPHPVQGWTPDFIPQNMDAAVYDELLHVTGPQAIGASKDLARVEGIFTGISGGATMWTALEVAKTAPDGANILAMLPDTGERYLSTPLFADIAADMNEAELAISQSTPGYQLE